MKPVASPAQTKARAIAAGLEQLLASGALAVGGRLPSESSLAATHGVSRTVVREAIAVLRAGGLVQSRQGAGVYVIRQTRAGNDLLKPVDPSRVSSAIELLELRAAVEIEAAGLAAERRSPAQEGRVLETCAAFQSALDRGQPTADADFAFHQSIALATNNPRFAEFLDMIGSSIIPRRRISGEGDGQVSADYLRKIQAEHEAIASAISQSDPGAARAAMRAHLEGSSVRYRAMIE